MRDDDSGSDSNALISADPGKSIHDLNNMLASIVGGLQLLAMRYRDDERTQKIVSNAQISVAEIRDFVAQALKRSRAVDVQDETSGSNTRASDIADLNEKDRAALFFSAIEMTRMPMIVTDPHQPDNPIIFANQAFLLTSGYAIEEVMGRNCRFLQGEETDRDKIAQIRDAISQKTDVFVEVQNRRKDGSVFWNALFISPIFDSDGQLLYYFGSQLDVTRRREAESALRRAQKMEAIGQLTGGIAHDFNNLMQIVIGNTQLARASHLSPEKLGRHHDAILNAAQKAKGLTQQLLAFSRQQPLETRVVSLNLLLTDLEVLLAKTLGSNIRLSLDLGEAVSNVSIDVIQLETTLINVLANARDAMPSGGDVVVKTRNVQGEGQGRSFGTLGDAVEIAISDSGEGMSQAVLAHVTEPFFTTKEVGKGTGLGLAQVYGFVQQSKGVFSIDSQEGKGTTVRLRFPVDRASGASVVKPDDHQPKYGQGETILVVEDNAEVRELACAILEEDGYTVCQADSARHGLDLFRQKPEAIDMVFTDIIMPGQMNGVALAKEIRKARPEIAILITTGFAQDIHGHTNSSEFETIYKPYLPQELSDKVRGVLSRDATHRS